MMPKMAFNVFIFHLIMASGRGLSGQEVMHASCIMQGAIIKVHCAGTYHGGRDSDGEIGCRAGGRGGNVGRGEGQEETEKEEDEAKTKIEVKYKKGKV